MLHLLRSQELGLFDIDYRTGLGHRHDQIGLPGQKGWQLDNVTDFSHRCRLMRLVHIGDDRDIEGAFDLLEDL